MIIELYGVPGSGKTTMIDKIKGKSVSCSEKAGIKSVALYTIKKLAAYTPSSIKYKRKINGIIGETDIKPLYISTSLHKNLNNIVMIAFGYKHINNLVYMDEGIIHRIMTFGINYNISIENTFQIIDVFEDCMRDVKSYFLKVSIDECLQSIKKRNRHKYKMDELRNEKLIEFLKKYEEYSKAICKNYGHTVITRDNFEELKK